MDGIHKDMGVGGRGSKKTMNGSDFVIPRPKAEEPPQHGTLEISRAVRDDGPGRFAHHFPEAAFDCEAAAVSQDGPVADDAADEETGASPGTARACSELGLNSLAANLDRFGIKPPGQP